MRGSKKCEHRAIQPCSGRRFSVEAPPDARALGPAKAARRRRTPQAPSESILLEGCLSSCRGGARVQFSRRRGMGSACGLVQHALPLRRGALPRGRGNHGQVQDLPGAALQAFFGTSSLVTTTGFAPTVIFKVTLPSASGGENRHVYGCICGLRSGGRFEVSSRGALADTCHCEFQSRGRRRRAATST